MESGTRFCFWVQTENSALQKCLLGKIPNPWTASVGCRLCDCITKWCIGHTNKMGLLQNSSLKKIALWKIMHKTRNLFGAKTAQKGFRVSDFALFLCASCYRIFILQQPLLWENDHETQMINYLPRCQMSRSYSAMVRSEENIPALAMFTRHFLRQPMGLQA